MRQMTLEEIWVGGRGLQADPGSPQLHKPLRTRPLPVEPLRGFDSSLGRIRNRTSRPLEHLHGTDASTQLS